MESEGAYVLRENTGTSGLEQTVRAAISILADHQIPHLIAGGVAVQEHGYFRVTLDVDLIVPDVLDAMEILTADLSGPFERVPGIEDTVRDRRNRVLVNLLPAGRVYKRPSKVPFPAPEDVTDQPRFVTLEQLISLKLDSWATNPTRRLKDKADVVELIQRLKLPRDFAVAEPVRHLYTEAWDALAGEK